jgi:hypothetical protein
MSIVKKCNRCGAKAYIERDEKCFDCIRDEDPDSVLVGLHLQRNQLDEDYSSVVREAQSHFPRIVHTEDLDQIDEFYETELDLYEQLALMRNFDLRYPYDNCGGRTKKQRILRALKKAYRDSIEIKFETSIEGRNVEEDIRDVISRMNC